MGKLDKAASPAQSFRASGRLSLHYDAIWAFFAFSDIIFIVFSSLIAKYAYNEIFYNLNDSMHSAFGIGFVVAIIFVLIAKNLNLYELSRLLAPSQYILIILMAWGFSILLVTAMLFFLRSGTDFSRGSTIVFAIVAVVPLILSRLFAATALQSLIAQGSISGRRALIIGEAFELDQLVASSLLVNFGLTEVARISLGGSSKFEKLANEELAKLDYAIAVARQQGVEELVIAFDWRRSELIEMIGERLRVSPLPVRLLPDCVVRSYLERGFFSPIRPIPSVELQRAPLSRSERIVKRACDVVLSSIALVVLAPVMVMLALIIKLDSAGPVIFRQRRTGFDGRTFFIYKFRSMSVMEDGQHVVQARLDDPRVTKVGRLLRGSSIDELPQIFNVLRGEMSLVGPRPHAVAHDDHYGAMISSYACRHHVKPGITGWAQVNGMRGETRQIEDMEKRIDHDLWYINNWSLGLDFKIIWRTLFEPLRHRAY